MVTGESGVESRLRSERLLQWRYRCEQKKSCAVFAFGTAERCHRHMHVKLTCLKAVSVTWHIGVGRIGGTGICHSSVHAITLLQKVLATDLERSVDLRYYIRDGCSQRLNGTTDTGGLSHSAFAC